MPKNPKQPTGGGAGPGDSEGVERLRETLKRLGDEWKLYISGQKKLGEALAASLRLLKDQAKLLGGDLRSALTGATAAEKKYVDESKKAASASAELAKEGKQAGVVMEFFAGLLAGAVLTGVGKVFSAISERLSPSMEALTGGFAKATKESDAFRREQIRLAVAFERGQSSVFGISKALNALGTVVLGSVTAAQAEFLGGLLEVSSLLTGVGGIALRATGAFVTYGTAIKDLLPALNAFGRLIGNTALQNVSKFGDAVKIVSNLVGVGFVAAMTGARKAASALIAVLARGLVLLFTTLPGLILLAAAALAALAIKQYASAKATIFQNETYDQYIKRLRNGSEAEKAVAKQLELTRKQMELQTKEMKTQIEIEAAIARGDTARAARLQRRIELEKLQARQLQERNEMEEGFRTSQRPVPEVEQAAERQRVFLKQQAELRALLINLDKEAVGLKVQEIQRTQELVEREQARQRVVRETTEIERKGRLDALESEMRLAEATGSSLDIRLAIAKDYQAALLESREAAREEAAEAVRASKARADALGQELGTLEKQAEAFEGSKEAAGLLDSKVRDTRDALADELALGDQRLAQLRELAADTQAITAATVARVAAEREGVEIQNRIKDVDEEIARLQGRFDPRRAAEERGREVRRGLARFGRNTTLDQERDLERQISHGLRYAEESGDKRLQEQFLKQKKQFEEKRAARNKDEIKSLRQQEVAATDELARAGRDVVAIDQAITGELQKWVDKIKEASVAHDEYNARAEQTIALFNKFRDAGLNPILTLDAYGTGIGGFAQTGPG